MIFVQLKEIKGKDDISSRQESALRLLIYFKDTDTRARNINHQTLTLLLFKYFH